MSSLSTGCSPSPAVVQSCSIPSSTRIEPHRLCRKRSQKGTSVEQPASSIKPSNALGELREQAVDVERIVELGNVQPRRKQTPTGGQTERIPQDTVIPRLTNLVHRFCHEMIQRKCKKNGRRMMVCSQKSPTVEELPTSACIRWKR